MEFVVVIRRVGEHSNGLVFQGGPGAVWRKLREKLTSKVTIRQQRKWPKLARDFVRDNYGTVPAAELARIMSRRFGRVYSKGSVIGMANRMGLCRK